MRIIFVTAGFNSKLTRVYRVSSKCYLNVLLVFKPILIARLSSVCSSTFVFHVVHKTS